jgi:excinuclease ABC subunit C
MPLESDELRSKIKSLPTKPGVYQYFDDSGTIIYVGKAKNLKSRVSSYFNKNIENGKTKLLVKRIVDVRYMVVDTENDALLLENSLIKKYQPKYNIQLKDDKTYPWICIKKEAFPRVFSTRRMIRDGSRYFGPYPNVKVLNTLLVLLKELYPIRNCNLDLSAPKVVQKKYKVCLEYHIGNCKGPCESKESEEEYKRYIQQIENILKGNLNSVTAILKEMMQGYATKFLFEQAQEIKEKIETIERYRAKSTVVSPSIDAVDVLTFLEDEKSFFVNYLVISNGVIIHGYTTEIRKKLEEKVLDIIGYVLTEFRERFSSESKEVLLAETVDLLLPGVDFFVPQRGDKKQLIDLSTRNASFYRLEKLKQEKLVHPEKHVDRILEQLKRDFRLQDLPRHMECFDNSNIQGTNAVSACVVFKNAKPSKKEYRHFNVKTVIGPDDYATMEEVIFRRYKRVLEEKQSLPQLIIIDGGKGQLSAALKALEKLNIRGKVAIVGIAKRLEELFFPGDSLPIYLDKRSESLKVIQHLRNEAHRFGITHHRNQRSKSALASEIVQIDGIGPKTQEELMKSFKTVKWIKKATLDELTLAIGPAKARIVWFYFNKE